MSAKQIKPETIRRCFTVIAEFAAIVAAVAACIALYIQSAEREPVLQTFALVQATSRIENRTMTPHLRLFVSVLNRGDREIVFNYAVANFRRGNEEFTYRLIDSGFSNNYKVAPRQYLNFETNIKPEVLLPSRAKGEILLEDTTEHRFSESISFSDAVEIDWQTNVESSDRFNSLFKSK